jgi:hypothetical protein
MILIWSLKVRISYLYETAPFDLPLAVKGTIHSLREALSSTSGCFCKHYSKLSIGPNCPYKLSFAVSQIWSWYSKLSSIKLRQVTSFFPESVSECFFLHFSVLATSTKCQQKRKVPYCLHYSNFAAWQRCHAHRGHRGMCPLRFVLFKKIQNIHNVL